MKINVICPKCNTSLEIVDKNDAALYIGKAFQFARSFSDEGDAKASVLSPEGLESQNSFAIAERFYEYAFAIDQIMKNDIKDKQVIDIGSAMTVLAAVVAKLGNDVTCIDFQKWSSHLDRVSYLSCDLIAGCPTLKPHSFDFGLCISTIEHVGLGRWKDPEDVYGDVKGMQTIYELLKPGALLVLTVPVGLAEVSFPAHRIYNQSRLKKITKDFKVIEEKFYCLENNGMEFKPCSSDVAFNLSKTEAVNYNIGCFLLEKI
jgi:2-polyprenyl-3-methyl-5-hydroxy-6-metoxy-1,4-benzoquinol methylase